MKCNQILHLEACDGRKLFILDNWQDGKRTSESTLIMKGAAPSLPHDTITDYRPSQRKRKNLSQVM